MSRADVEAGKAYVRIYTKQSDLTKGLNKAKQELQSFGSGIAQVGAGVFAMGSAITGSLVGAVMHFANVGSALNDMSARTGMSTTALVELGHAAEMTGTDMGMVEKAVGRMQKQIGGAGPESDKLAATLDRVGLSVADLAGMAPDEQFSKIAGAIAEISDPAEKTATAMEIFGRSGTQLLPMINDLEALRKEARDLGLAPSPESIAAADQIGDAIDRLRKVASAAFFEIGAAVAPMASDIIAGFMEIISSVRKFISANKSLIVTAAKIGVILSTVGAAVMAIGAGFIAAGLAISGVMSVVAAFSAAIGLVGTLLSVAGAAIAVVLSPMGLLVAALVGGAIAWAKFTDSGKAAVSGLTGSVTTLFGDLSKTVTDTFGGIFTAISKGDLALAGQIAMVGLRLAVTQGTEAITEIFGGTIGALVGQIASGDLAGAWGTLGSSILSSVAGIANGMVALFTAATNAIIGKWRSMVDELANSILSQAGAGGIFGDAFSVISGVNVQGQMMRAKRLEDERRAKGLNPQDNDIAAQIAAGTYQDPTIAAIEARAKAATAGAAGMAQDAADATQAAVDNAVDSQTKATSDKVKQLKDELLALRFAADAKIAAGNSGAVDAAAAAAAGGAGGGVMGGKSSVATNNLMALAAMASSPQDRQVRIGEQQLKKADKQLEKMDLQILAIEKLGLFHA